MSWKRLVVPVFVGVLALPLPAIPATAAPPPTDLANSVTLVTGDRVLLGPGGDLRQVEPGPGRAGMTFMTSVEGGRLTVLPRDANVIVAGGRVDRRLFDVTGLLAAGYDDRSRDDLPLMLTQTPGLMARSNDPAVAGLHVGDDLPVLSAVTATVDKATAAQSWQRLTGSESTGTRVWLDGMRKPLLDRSTAQIGAPLAWQAGVTGKGVKVAVLDTGVDEKHPDLVGKQLAEKNFTTDPDMVDRVGHGTHVGATIASAGAKYRGVAPDAQVLDGKVCTEGGCSDSAVLAGMQWAVDQGAKIVNLSLGAPDAPGIDPLEEAVDALSARNGTLFVVSAGNSGPDGGTLSSPASADAALAVGAVNRSDAMASFSSRGPRIGDGGVKPDITAPGVGIVAAEAGSAGHVAKSGTSMAAPHVAGAAALLAQTHPDWTGDQLKAVLMGSAVPNPKAGAFEQGAGRVDVGRALAQTVIAQPASLALGLQSWPHDDDLPVRREVTYRNSGASTISLDLRIDATGPDGTPAPAGAFTVQPGTLTVPAGGEAKATVTADTRTAAMADGITTGTLVASGDGRQARTPLSVLRESESYNLGITQLDRDGKPAADASLWLVDVRTGQAVPFQQRDGAVTVRVAKGEYTALTSIGSADGRVDILGYPGLRVDKDTAITLDARQAKPVSITPPTPFEQQAAQVGIQRRTGGNPMTVTFLLESFTGVGLANVGPAVGHDDFTTVVAWQAKATGTDKPTLYHFAFPVGGAVPTGFERTPKPRDLAEVRRSVARSGAGGLLGAMPMINGRFGAGTTFFAVPVGAEVVEMITPGAWVSNFIQLDQDQRTQYDSDTLTREFRAGKVYRERTNFAVFSPVIPPADRTSAGVRQGDEIAFKFSGQLFGSNSGGIARSSMDSISTALFRDGTKVGETDTRGVAVFEVPSERANYRVETKATRSGFDVSTSVSAAWTFTSASGGDEFTELPLSVVRFAPKLDDENASPVGRTLVIPLSVQQRGDGGRIKRIEVQASFDDGKTWSDVAVRGNRAVLRNADQPGFASLRAKAIDSKGNTVELTVLRAYRVV